jgi:type III pantothenate kinase
MNVALDLRNGCFSLGLKEGGAWLIRRRFGLDPRKTADDWALVFSAILSESGLSGAKAARAIMSSVVPASCRAIKSALAEVFGASVLLVGPGMRTGLKIRTDVPSELGTDLVCMAVAANALYPQDLVVVDSSGATLSFSAVNAKGEFLGAAFVPGIEAAASSLRAQAAQLPQVDLEAPSRAIGRNTAQALASGIVNGYRGLMDGLIADMAREMGIDPGRSPIVVGSGVDPEPLVAPTKGFDHYDPWLCLEGLSILGERNAQDGPRA